MTWDLHRTGLAAPLDYTLVQNLLLDLRFALIYLSQSLIVQLAKESGPLHAPVIHFERTETTTCGKITKSTLLYP